VTAPKLLAIDQGTTGTTALVMGIDGMTLGRATEELPQIYPEPGWVEHDPDQIWATVVRATREALKSANVRPTEIAAIGVSNQRETVVAYERETGRPVHHAIVWQDRRTADLCAELKRSGHEPAVQKVTGLVIDPYFSATKMTWLLDHCGLRGRSEAGELVLGTVDTLLVNRLAGGTAAGAPHVTDVTNASRTLLMDLGTRRWHPGMCELFRVPPRCLPTIVPTAGPVAETHGFADLPDGVPIAALVGDQQAALFGQGCFEPGDVKCTYGTGAFVLVNTGDRPVLSRSRLLSTVAWQLGSEVTYALEGSCFVAGAAVQWLRDGLGILQTAAEVEALARSVDSTGGVVFVPALAGLGAPHWDPGARGLISGLTRGTTAAHLARATLEAIAHEVDDLIASMSSDFGRPINRMRVDGGAAANDLLMELQSDCSALTVERPTELESTARGAAMLAGVGAGLFPNGREAAHMIRIDRVFCPRISDADRRANKARWHEAVRRARGQKARNDG
jgi:glycerol kinase